jgi:hypothetical protein
VYNFHNVALWYSVTHVASLPSSRVPHMCCQRLGFLSPCYIKPLTTALLEHTTTIVGTQHFDMVHIKKTARLSCIWQCPSAQRHHVEQSPPDSGGEGGTSISDHGGGAAPLVHWPWSRLLVLRWVLQIWRSRKEFGGWWRRGDCDRGSRVTATWIVGTGWVAVWGRGWDDARGARGVVGILRVQTWGR